MANLPRKLLFVRREPPDNGWNLMLEINGNRTMTLQLPLDVGDELMAQMQDIIIKFAVQRGFSTLDEKRSRS